MESFLRYGLDEVASAYLERRALVGEAIDRLRFGRVSTDLPREHPHRRYAGRLVIPSFSARGTITDIAFRCIEDHPDCGALNHAKYLFVPGSSKKLYNVGAVTTASDTVHILEGQLNAASLVACGEAAVGCTGADSWKPHYWRLFQGFDRVLVWRDGDDKEPPLDKEGKPRPKGGDLFTGKVLRDIRHAEVVECPAGYDANTYLMEHGRDALLALSAAGDSYDGIDDAGDEPAEGLEPEDLDAARALDRAEGESDDAVEDKWADWDEPYEPPPF